MKMKMTMRLMVRARRRRTTTTMTTTGKRRRGVMMTAGTAKMTAARSGKSGGTTTMTTTTTTATGKRTRGVMTTAGTAKTTTASSGENGGTTTTTTTTKTKTKATTGARGGGGRNDDRHGGGRDRQRSYSPDCRHDDRHGRRLLLPLALCDSALRCSTCVVSPTTPRGTVAIFASLAMRLFISSDKANAPSIDEQSNDQNNPAKPDLIKKLAGQHAYATTAISKPLPCFSPASTSGVSSTPSL
mmetsp:Transcript_38865/g.64499  ORF Transcript_38865/g.64499 Transcript_38865/m.64499 type:complete len:243 (+) Transcript_38865:1374-2102(+)